MASRSPGASSAGCSYLSRRIRFGWAASGRQPSLVGRSRDWRNGTGLVQAAGRLRRLRERAPAEHAFVDWVASAAKCDRSSMPIQFPEAVLAQTTGPRV